MDWEVTRFADKVKNTHVDENKEALANLRLPIYFRQAHFGKLTNPATIVDMHGKVMVWALPRVLHPRRLVKKTMLTSASTFLKYFNRRTSTKQYINLISL